MISFSQVPRPLAKIGFVKAKVTSRNHDLRGTQKAYIAEHVKARPFTVYIVYIHFHSEAWPRVGPRGLTFIQVIRFIRSSQAKAHLCRDPGLIISSRRPVHRRFRPRLMTQLDCPQGTPVPGTILEPLPLDLRDAVGRSQAGGELGHGTSVPELLVQIHKPHQIPHIKGTHQQGGRICVLATISLCGPVTKWRYHVGEGVGIVPAPGIIVKVDLPERIVVDDA